MQILQGIGSRGFLYQLLKSAFTPNVNSVLSENLGGILGGTQC